MKKTIKKRNPSLRLAFIIVLVLSGFTNFNVLAQEKLSGTVTDKDGNLLPGVSILQKGTRNGTSSDFDGNYKITLKTGEKTLVFSYLGFKTLEIPVKGRKVINVSLSESSETLDEIVVIGYGTQKKASVVGAISQIKGAELQEANLGVTNVQEALQGALPGVVAIQGSGVPGRNDMQLFVRGQSSWNGNGQPLILVDGVPRDIDNIDFNDIENISVLKDASATAVYGVQGADGVVLLTTKRGKTGKAQLSLTANTTMRTVSRLPGKLDAFDAITQSNRAVLRELAYDEALWNNYRPQEIVNLHRFPRNEQDALVYPNVNWEDAITKDYAVDYRINLSVRGGGDNSKYFGSLAYQKVSDIFDGARYDNGKGYESEFAYDRFNFRSNLDFNITETTQFSVNLGGFLGIQKSPGNLNLITNSIYELAPNIYSPVFPDGYFGRDQTDIFANSNPIVQLTNTGFTTTRTFNITTDFILRQNLDFITKGLSFKGAFSFDNQSVSNQSLRDPGGDGQENVRYRIFDEFFNEIIESPNGTNDFAYVPTPWTYGSADIPNSRIRRNITYDLSLNYSRTFDEKHDVSVLALFRRQQRATGSQFPVLREDWVGRVQYSFDDRYLLDVSGAYNGSEKYGPDFRFDLFPAVGAGWIVSNEDFMSDVKWLNKLKFRGSYGQIGSDNGGARFAYQQLWGTSPGAYIQSGQGQSRQRSPYQFFQQLSIGNPNLQWETSEKYDFAVEMGVLNNKITGEFSYFRENRSNILIPGSQRAVPDLIGATPPPFNRGKTEVRGYEIVIGVNHTFDNGLNLNARFNFNQAINKVIDREDPALAPDYLKAAGFPIQQPRSGIPDAILTNWDDIYSSTPRVNGQEFTRAGYYNVNDYDGDGVYNGNFDNVPYGYGNQPQRFWTANLGARYKAWSISAQLYGSQNASRTYTSRTFSNQSDTFFVHELDYWTKDNPTATRTLPGYGVGQGTTDPRRSLFDASVVRLRSVALSYQVPKSACKKLGVSSLKLFANGNNLFLWTDLPDDREFNSSLTADSRFRGDYPTLVTYNFGFNLNF
ncbi:SusC/RagA family TonB-linked outer membrane protein [Polaribacter septentrionalilitoris]|uniref:SusC/RagA family TonB-linked outer membrane protein n=1 Tax=Polaribacter septentrionalilitoris TaxID=2494657 RepID=UPI001358A4A3|nr:TonB-dependent receptor [Polaribacter septentrionalilitoris]